MGDEAALGVVGDGVEDVMLSWPEAVVREGWWVALLSRLKGTENGSGGNEMLVVIGLKWVGVCRRSQASLTGEGIRAGAGADLGVRHADETVSVLELDGAAALCFQVALDGMLFPACCFVI
jgi:hypothetical protein